MAGLEISRRLTDESCVLSDRSGKSCWVVTTAESPFTIIAASPGWHQLWGFEPAEVAGKSISVLNGVGHDVAACSRVGQNYITSGSAYERCRNTSKYGQVRRVQAPSRPECCCDDVSAD